MLEKYAKMIMWSLTNYPDCDIFGSLGPNQLDSKQWMFDVLGKLRPMYGPWSQADGSWDDKQGNAVEIVGSWYCYPMIEMLEKFPLQRIDCWDIDFEARQISEQYLKVMKPKCPVDIMCEDYFNHERWGSRANLLINTSSEHMTDSFYMMDERWGVPREHLGGQKQFYVKKPIIVIQSNNMRHIEEHVNCVDSADELVERHRIREVFYAGERNMVEWHEEEIKENGYKRFMVIGKL